MSTKISVIFLSVGLLSLLSSCATVASLLGLKPKPGSLEYAPFPARPPNSATGSQFIAATRNYTSDQRERAILDEVLKGNVPDHLRTLKPIKLVHRYGGMVYTGYVYVTPDYISIGSDKDFVRMPMTPITAQKIADKFGFVLPTRKLVNEIYNQAQIKLTPRPLPAGRQMTSNTYYQNHNQTIEQQLGFRGGGDLIAGHKKDVVISNRLLSLPSRVAIYGWHRSIGNPIQPLSLVHGNTYADYSHGVRFVHHIMRVGKYKMYVRDVLKDRKLSGLVSDEGPVSQSRQRLSQLNLRPHLQVPAH